MHLDFIVVLLEHLFQKQTSMKRMVVSRFVLQYLPDKVTPTVTSPAWYIESALVQTQKYQVFIYLPRCNAYSTNYQYTITFVSGNDVTVDVAIFM